VAVAMVHDATNVEDRNTAWLLVKTLQPAIHGLDLTVSFDPATTLNQVRSGSLGRNHSLAMHSPAPGTARIAAASAVAVSGEGVLLELQFSQPPVGLELTSIRVDESRVATVPDPALNIFDTDHDGVINVVETEIRHTDPSVADTDHDGQSDGQEVTAGTSPTDANSCFAIKSAVLAPGGQLQLTWTSVPGRIYQLQSTADLQHPAWVDEQPPITANESITSKIVTRPPAARQQFYRVTVRLPE
jgi:hypothetical protein